jgi:hypothetical protein
MTIFKQLWQANQDIAQACLEHPFVFSFLAVLLGMHNCGLLPQYNCWEAAAHDSAFPCSAWEREKEDIVLRFQSPFMRQFTEYAVG